MPRRKDGAVRRAKQNVSSWDGRIGSSGSRDSDVEEGKGEGPLAAWLPLALRRHRQGPLLLRGTWEKEAGSRRGEVNLATQGWPGP